MLIPIRKTVQLSGGAVTLRAWPATVADAHLLDLLTLCATLGQMREEWQEFTPGDVEPQLWPAFWRLAEASLEAGSRYPAPLSWLDCLTVLNAMWELNDMEEAEGKLKALSSRAVRLLKRTREAQGRTMIL